MHGTANLVMESIVRLEPTKHPWRWYSGRITAAALEMDFDPVLIPIPSVPDRSQVYNNILHFLSSVFKIHSPVNYHRRLSHKHR